MTDESQRQKNRRTRKVGPDPAENGDVVEIRKNRLLRIQHFNPRKRSEKLEKEIQMILKYRQNGITQSPMQTPRKQGADNPSFTRKNELQESIPKTEQLDKKLANTQGTHNIAEKEMPGCVPSMGDAASMINAEGRPQTIDPREKMTLLSRVSRDSMLSSDRKTVMSSSGIVVCMHDPSANSANHINITDKQKSKDTNKDKIQNSSQLINRKILEETSTVTLAQISNNSVSDTSPSVAGTSGIDRLKETIHVKEASEIPQEVLFFFHGVGGASDIWKSQLTHFSNLGYEIICPDLIGHGLSCSPNNARSYHFQEILHDIELIFDLYCKEKNVIVGHSYGCAFATVLARRRARRVSKLILVSGGGPIPLAPQVGIFSLPLCLLSCIKPCITCVFRRNAFHSDYKDHHKYAAFDVPAYVLSHIMNGQWWLDGDELYHSWLAVPTLLIWGRHDKFVTLEEEEEMLRVVYGSKLEIIEKAGHMVMMEAPVEFNQVLFNFMKDIPEYSASTNETLAKDKSTNENSQIVDENHTQRSVEIVSPKLNKSSQRAESKESLGSMQSLRSYKSRKSMPNGVLSHRGRSSAN